MNDALQIVEDAVIKVGQELTRIHLTFRRDPTSPTIDPNTWCDEYVGARIKELLQPTGLPVYREGHDHPDERMTRYAFWWNDPIDGTSRFMRGEEFGISVGLVQNQKPVMGVVYQPRIGRLFTAVAREGAYQQLRTEKKRKLSVSRKTNIGKCLAALGTTKDVTPQIYQELDIQMGKPVGGFTYKVCQIALKEADLYIKPNVLCNEWDSCAVQLILEEAGGKLTDFYGNPLEYNKPDPRHRKGIVASNGLIHDQVIEFLQREYISTGNIPL